MGISPRKARNALVVLSLSITISPLVAPLYGAHKAVMTPSVTHMPALATPQFYAKTLYIQSGATLREWGCLKVLWQRESHWDYRARNPRGGAYGIPQAWPATKMAQMGADWQTNPYTQIRWGLKYVRLHWNNKACGALAHSNRKGWY